MTTQRAKILVLDDDAELRAMLERYLSQHDYLVRTVADARQLERLLVREPFDLLILDLTMPGEDGLSVCNRLRSQGETLPILMLTARGDPVDRILGLEVGADDYLAKPFNPRELLARVQAHLRRQHMLGAAPAALTEAPITFGPYTLDVSRRTLKRGEALVELTSGEFELLRALATHPNRPLGRERLVELARGRDISLGDRAVDVQILRLRRLIEVDPTNPRFIQTVRGVGYVFVSEAEAS
ncbi:osmolarity response regulator transcription factor OmpR [Parachitinimonas caeni]|uniref:Two-component system response regulator OmpR n=1 Tax=Parachitinimonas caeni TaxID=3031301 RepID=A0ABT7DW57_9NEIS|nr:two-component system response regulator OmpR [Parachitinimonas caeni]MDK2124294.1 two-component system response regulator OmpR [Parachitinimonas caeni]